jgi:hypothetical protein
MVSERLSALFTEFIMSGIVGLAVAAFHFGKSP